MLVKEDRVQTIINSKSLNDIVLDLKKAKNWLLIAAIAAFLASAFFVVKYFVGGSMNPETWTMEQWLNAALGLGITAVITAAQAFLYASGYKGAAAIIATLVVVFFGLFSEISQSMEREDYTVKHRSTSSEVYKAALNVAQTTPQINIQTPYALKAASADVARIEARIVNKDKCRNCETATYTELRQQLADAKAKLEAEKAALNSQAAIASSAVAAAQASALDKAKALEYDEDKHYAIIRFIKESLGVTAIWASFIFSLIIIGTFEYAFHFVGNFVANHKRALWLLGRDSEGNPVEDNKVLRTGTQVSPYSPDDKTQQNTDLKPDSFKRNRLILLQVHSALKDKRITKITKRNDGELFECIKRTGQVKGSNDQIYEVMEWVIDCLLQEGIIVPNPDKGSARNKPDYIIDYKHSIFNQA